jgi:hypothetical protein
MKKKKTYREIAISRYNKEIESFKKAMELDAEEGDGDYNVYFFASHLGLNCLKYARLRGIDPAELFGAALVSYDERGYGESVIIGALEYDTDCEEEIRGVWGFEI